MSLKSFQIQSNSHVVGRRGSNIPAMHALATILGASRDFRDLGADLMDQGDEDAIRSSIYEACGLKPPGESLWANLRQPDEESKSATYRQVHTELDALISTCIRKRYQAERKES